MLAVSYCKLSDDTHLLLLLLMILLLAGTLFDVAVDATLLILCVPLIRNNQYIL